MPRPSVVELLNGEHGFWLAGLAREVWPVAQHHLDALTPDARACVEHYRDHLPRCLTYNEPDGCEGCRHA